MQYLMGIDIGTSGTKTVLFDTKGQAIADATHEYPLLQPENGWAEQNPTDWLEAVILTIQKVLALSDIDPKAIAGIGLSGQMHGLVMLDKDHQVLRPAIIWCDQRTANECEQITDLVGKEKLLSITANPALTGFTASKILWVRNNEPKIYDKTKKILLPKDYIRFCLTGEFATEVSDASGMQLLNVGKRKWSDTILSSLDIDKALLAPVFESIEVSGKIDKKAAELTGLAEGTPVVGGGGDNAAAAIGTGVISDHQAFTTIGSSGVVYAHTSQMRMDPKGRVHTFCCAVPDMWHVMGVTQGAGLSLKWFRDALCKEEINVAEQLQKSPYMLMDRQAARVPIGSDKLLFLPYLMGERTPHLDPYARGVFFGLSARHEKSHMIRAILEGVSFSLKDCLTVVSDIGVDVKTMRATGGGSNAMWQQMLSDVYDCPVTTISASQGPALGVALLAGAATGVYKNLHEACEVAIKEKDVAQPDPESVRVYARYYKLFQQLYPALKNSYRTLSDL